LDVKLKWPFRRIIAVAEFDFNPAENNQLPLKKGCQVTVLSKEGDYKGWWKGKIQDRVSNYNEFYLPFYFGCKGDEVVLVLHLPCICKGSLVILVTVYRLHSQCSTPGGAKFFSSS
jgi:hypothetical protein